MTGQLHDRLATLGTETIVHVLTQHARGRDLASSGQSSQGITYAHKITPDEAEINWSAPAVEIDRKIRAFNPAPGAWTTWQGEKLKLWSSALASVPSGIDSQADNVLPAEGEHLLVGCGSSVLAITEIQQLGGKRMAAGIRRSASDSASGGIMSGTDLDLRSARARLPPGFVAKRPKLRLKDATASR